MEMECVVAKALKTSLRDEMLACRSRDQDQSSKEDDDYWGASSVVSGGEELFVDGFLDLSNEGAAEGCTEEGNDAEEEEDGEEEEEKACSVSSSTADENSSSSFCNSAKDEFGAGIDLSTDDLAALEWLSHFVEDSFTEFPTLPYTVSKPSPRPSPPTLAQVQVPAKARSKRNRAGARVWSLHAPQPTESSTSSSSSTVTENNHDSYQKPPSKKTKPVKDRKSESARRCSHCLVQKTPQWRTGPMGAKTLCNACGVRYKSGRLLPEYRPAGSPTFVSHVHSNSHKKVLEMRRRKEDRFQASSAPSAVESF